MARLTYSAMPLVAATLFSVPSCGADPIPADTDASSDDGNDASDQGIDPDSSGGDVCEPACLADECCFSGSCFNAPDPDCGAPCAVGEVCQCPEGSDPCDCAAECVPSDCGIEGEYVGCIGEDGITDGTLCPENSICVSDGSAMAPPTISICTLTDCQSACDCPFAPLTGDAPVTCDNITAGDMDPECHLSCADGESCPDDMICVGGFLCAFPAFTPMPMPLFGDCQNNGGTCPDGFCLQGTDAAVCSAECETPADCVPAPTTGDAPIVCEDVTGDMMPECLLDCSADQTCPDGMSCFAGSICMWLDDNIVVEPLYGNCTEDSGSACDSGLFCLTAPDGAVCTDSCTTVADCEPAPATGDAALDCRDVTGDMMPECLLDCSAGQTCPDDMLCFGNNICVWPNDGLVLEPLYGNCTMDSGASCDSGLTCLTAPIGAVCTDGCTDVTECEPAPATGNAMLDCRDVTGDMMPECLLDCSAGQNCPDDMFCFGNNICVWLNADITLEPVFGDCVNGAVCDSGLTCVTAPDGSGVCTGPCIAAADCQPLPGTGTAPAVCTDITADMMSECSLSCAGGEVCPDGMTCFGDAFCLWPVAEDGYQNCGVPNNGCADAESCLSDDPVMPTWAVCSEADCTAASDCLLTAPEGGDAPAACGDPAGMGGVDTCYLDCSAGQTCPDGMACIDNAFCAWGQGPTLFEDDFETGDLSMGWTLNNVDGLMPNMAVDFVTDAWVVSDVPVAEEAGNFAATSTSWYDPAGTANDWLISPSIMLGPNTRVHWDSRTVDAGFPDGFELRISTAGTTIADFEANPPLLSIPAENADYTNHLVDLAPAGYMNQPVHLAWRNITNDGLLLKVDNVLVLDLP